MLGHSGDVGCWGPGHRGERRGGATERVRSSCGDFFSREWRQQATVRDLWTRGYNYWAIRLVLRPANGSVRRIGRPHRSIFEEQMAPTSCKLQFETITPLQARFA